MNQDKAPWEKFINPERLPYMPKGYMNVQQISQKIKKSQSWVLHVLQRARIDGTIDCIKGIDENNRECWFYKTKGETNESISNKNNRYKNKQKAQRRTGRKTSIKTKEVSFL